MPVSISNVSSTTEPTTAELLEIQRQVDGTYKNLLDNFDPDVKQLVNSGKHLFKSYLTLNDASKVYIDNLNKLASSGLRSKGETNTICTYLMEICNVWKELNKEHEEIIAFLGTQVLAPTETNLDQDSKILTEQWKRFQRGQKTIEKRIRSNRKNGIPVNGIVEELLKLKTDGLTKATNEEKKRYLFIMERHVAVVTLYIKLHRQALHQLEENVEKWREICSNPENVVRDIFTFIDNLPIDETPFGTGNRNNVEVHPEPQRRVSSDERSDSDLSSSTKKSSRNPSPIPDHKPEEGPELKLLRFQPMPESLKPLMENTTIIDTPEHTPIVYAPPSPVLVEKEVQTNILQEAASQTDTIKIKPILMPAPQTSHSNGQHSVVQQERQTTPPQHQPAMFQPPPPPPVSAYEEPATPSILIKYQQTASPPPPPAPILHTVTPTVTETRPPIPQTYTPVSTANAIKQAPVHVDRHTPVPGAILPLAPKPKETWKTPEPFTEQYAEAVYPYNANSANQLTLQEGDGIKIIQDGKFGWQFGENFRTREVGWFPASFVKSAKLQTVQVKEIPKITEVHSTPIPNQPRHSPDPPPLLRL